MIMEGKRIESSKQRLAERIEEAQTHLKKEEYDINELKRLKNHLEKRKRSLKKTSKRIKILKKKTKIISNFTKI